MLTKTNFVPPTLLLYSINEVGKTLATFKLRYPKMVHGDFMTHRVFSRNASSSRAIPTSKLSAATESDMYVPDFRMNKPGMQAGEYLSDHDQEDAASLWRFAADICLETAKKLSDKDGLNVHKQWANRMLEWFGYINVLVTACDFTNFIGLRESLDEEGWPEAQDEIYFQAAAMKKLLESSEPKLVHQGEWHLPMILPEEKDMLIGEKLRVSAARCASISYETVDGKPMTIERANIVCDKLLTAKRVHASPFEHQASPDPYYAAPGLHGNLAGWIQQRKLIPNECITRD